MFIVEVFRVHITAAQWADAAARSQLIQLLVPRIADTPSQCQWLSSFDFLRSGDSQLRHPSLAGDCARFGGVYWCASSILILSLTLVCFDSRIHIRIRVEYDKASGVLAALAALVTVSLGQGELRNSG